LDLGELIVLFSQRNDVVISFSLLGTAFEALRFVLLKRFGIKTHKVCFSQLRCKEGVKVRMIKLVPHEVILELRQTSAALP
jgi:hypothetical protein